MDVSTPKEPDEGGRRSESAIRHVQAHLWFWGLAGGLLGLDLWTKHWAFTALAPTEIRPILSGAIDLRRSLNDGAVFGSFAGYPSVFIVASLGALGVVLYMFAHSTRRQRALHVALALILAGALGNLYDRAFVVADVVKFNRPFGPKTSLIGTILSDPEDSVIRLGDWPDGAHIRSLPRSDVTNIQRQGVVRDFIKFVWKFPAWVPGFAGKDVWPWVFNIADATLVCGVGVLLIHIWLDRRPRASHV